MAVGQASRIDSIQSDILNDIARERMRQDAKHGQQFELGHLVFHAFTAEEFGEVSKATMELLNAMRRQQMLFAMSDSIEVSERIADLRRELIETATCCVKWVEKIDTEAQQRG